MSFLNKFKKGANGNDLVFPFSQKQIDELKDSQLKSPKVGKANGLRFVLDDNDDQYHIDEIKEIRYLVNRGYFPTKYIQKYYPFQGDAPTDLTEPLKFAGLRLRYPKYLANIVHMDSPIDLHLWVLKWIHAEGIKLKKDDTDQILFTESVTDVLEDVMDGLKKTMNKGFECKYFYGAQRPEEVIDLEITTYNEGCPNHPSYPAGHSCASGGGMLAFFKHFDLNKQQTKQLLDTAYLWGMFRSLAGVHWCDDNVAGLYLSLKKYFTKEAKNKYAL